MISMKHGVFTDQEWERLKAAGRLSLRQAQIVRGIFGGKTDQQIAMELGIAVPTVRTHLRRLYLKLEVRDRVELVLHFVSLFLQEYSDLLNREG